MAKPTKNAPLICTIMTAIALVGILIGVIAKSPIVILLAMAPSVGYEAYRTEGESTRWASWAMVGVLVLEFILLVFNIGFDVASFLGASSDTVAGYDVPLGDIRIVGPALMAVLSLILIVRTRGKFTRWLAANILVSVLAMTYVIDPNIFQQLLRQGIEEGVDSMG